MIKGFKVSTARACTQVALTLKNMNYGEIKKTDIANGPGVRVSLFVSGCTHHCRDCFQPETWNFGFGREYTAETEAEILEALAPDYITGLTVLGGEPMEPGNQRALLPLYRAVRERFPEKTIWVYSGYTLDREIMSTLPEGEVIPPEKPVDSLVAGEAVNALIVEGGREYREAWYRGGRGHGVPAKDNSPADMARRAAGLRRAVEQAGDDLVELTRDSMLIKLHAPFRSAHCEVTDEILSLIDVLVDGKFIFIEKDLSLRFRGSRNQRLIDVKRSLAKNAVVLWEG